MNRENKPLFLYTFITVFGGLIVGLNMAGVFGGGPFFQKSRSRSFLTGTIHVG